MTILEKISSGVFYKNFIDFYWRILSVLGIDRNDNSVNIVVKGSTAVLIFNILATGIGYINNLILARYYGAFAVGVYSIITMLVFSLSILSNMGLSRASIRFIPKFLLYEDGSYYIKILVVHIVKIISFFVVIFFLILFMGSEVISVKLFHKPYLMPYIRIASFVLIFNSFFIMFLNYLRSINDFKTYAFFYTFPYSILFLILLLLGIVVNRVVDDVGLIVSFAYFLSYFLLFITLFIITEKRFFSKFSVNLLDIFKIKLDKNILPKNKLYRYAISALTIDIAGFVMMWVDIFMLGVMDTTSNVGIYRIAYKLSVLVVFPVMAINYSVPAKYAELYEKREINSMINLMKRIILISGILSFVIFIILFVFAKELLLLFGPCFGKGVDVLRILLVMQLIVSIIGVSSEILMVTDYYKIVQYGIIFGAFLDVFLNYLLIPHYSILGTAISSTLSTLLIRFLWFFVVIVILKRKKEVF